MNLGTELQLLARIFAGRIPVAEILAHETLRDHFNQHYVAQRQALDPQEEMEADHYQIFGLEVFPYASVFLNSEPKLGGPEVEALLDLYHEAGFTPSQEADHLASELEYLAWLLEKKQGAQAHAFLYQHLLRWYFPLEKALLELEHPFFSGAITYLSGLLAELGRELPPQATPHQRPEARDLDLLSQEKTGLKEIAQFLLTPAYSGVYLSRMGLGDLSASLEAPAGFGTRSQLLPNLFYSAVDYGKMPALLQLLESQLQGWQAYYQAQAKTWGQAVEFWLEGVQVSLGMVQKMRGALVEA